MVCRTWILLLPAIAQLTNYILLFSVINSIIMCSNHCVMRHLTMIYSRWYMFPLYKFFLHLMCKNSIISAFVSCDHQPDFMAIFSKMNSSLWKLWKELVSVAWISTFVIHFASNLQGCQCFFTQQIFICCPTLAEFYGSYVAR